MNALTVQELIDQLSRVEDKGRKVMVAGGSTFDGVELLNRHASSGHVIIWCAEQLRAARPRIEVSQRRYIETVRRQQKAAALPKESGG